MVETVPPTIYARVTSDMRMLKNSLYLEYLTLTEFEVTLDSELANIMADVEARREKCNALSTSLYACKYDFIFDVSYLINEIKEYAYELETYENPGAVFKNRCVQEIYRDSCLLAEIQNYEPSADRDTCEYYISEVMLVYGKLQTAVSDIDSSYISLSEEFQKTVEYADRRYEQVTNSIYQAKQDPYIYVLTGYYHDLIVRDGLEKYVVWRDLFSSRDAITVAVQMLVMLLLVVFAFVLIHRFDKRKGKAGRFSGNTAIYANGAWILSMIVLLAIDVYLLNMNVITTVGSVGIVFLAFVMLILLSCTLNHDGKDVSEGLRLYMPVIAMSFGISTMRVLFMPDAWVTAILTPLALICLIWQIIVYVRHRKKADKVDRVMSAISLGVLAANFIGASIGYVFFSIQLFYWWQSELGILLFMISLYRMLIAYRNNHPEMEENNSWGFRLLYSVMLPIAFIATIPFCTYLSANMFNSGTAFSNAFFQPFYSSVDAEGVTTVSLSFFNIILVCCLIPVFNYLSDALQAMYTSVRTAIERMRKNRDSFRTNEINLTLGTNLITLFVWFSYIFLLSYLLAIPLSSMTFIFAGLAAGIGFALRDVLNNVIYGTQLMAGRLRVGDVIECDGLRGTVTGISYQATQIRTWDGAITNIANTTLFGKNFKNFTRASMYETVAISFGVAYGSDIQNVKDVVIAAVTPLLQGVDEYKRPLTSGSVGVNFVDMADSSLNFTCVFPILQEKRFATIIAARTAIYDALNSANIEIPFPQMDVHVKPE